MRSHAAVLAVLLAGCASSKLGQYYEEQDRWEDSYQVRRRVAESPGWFTSDADLAVIHYGLGRSAGVTCRWDEAVKEFQLAYELDLASGGRTDMDLFELGELYAHRQDWKLAAEYYGRGLADRPQGYDKRTGTVTHPADQIHVWTQYARALREIGRRDDSEIYYQKADELRARPGIPLDHAHWTPYGSQCAAERAQR